MLSLGPGGTEHLVVEMCRRLRPEFDIAVCCLDEAGAWAKHLTADGIEVTALGRGPGFRPSLGRRIADLAARRGARLLHCHHYSPFVYGRIAKSLRPSLKLVYTEHGRLSDAPPSWKRRLVNPWLARFDGPITSVSEDLRHHLIDAWFPAERVNVIHNGIAIGRPPSPAERHRARLLLGIDDEAFVAITVARLDPVKDFRTLLNAFAEVRRRVPHARLVIVGDGPERERIRVRAARHDLDGAVLLTGYRSDVRTLLPAADLYVNSSISEGISVTILEAMAAASAVVATAVGGTPEIVDGTTGVLVRPRDPQALAHAITTVALDDERRAKLAAAGRRRVEAHFTIDRMVDQYARAYRQLLG